MHVIARTDPHAAREEVRAAHPDWIAVTKDGQPYRHWANPELWVTCALGPYNFEFMDRGAARDRHALQGRRDLRQPLGADRGTATASTASANFKDATGLELPRGTDAAGPGAPAVHSMAEGAADGAVEALRRRHPRDQSGGVLHSRTARPISKTAGELAHIQFTDNQARRGVTPPWANGHRAKEFRSVMGRRPIGGIFSVGLEEPYRWKDSVQSEPEIRLWVAEGTANGMRPWVTKFSGVLYDRRWLPIGRAHLPVARQARAIPAQRDAARARRAAALGADRDVPSGRGRGRPRRRSRARHVSRARRGAGAVRDGARGVPHARPARPVQAADPRGRGGVVRRAVRARFARTSSAAAACWRRSRRRSTTSSGVRRADFGLADLFGVSFGGRIDGPMQNSYLSLETDPATGTRHPILDGLDDTPRIINGVFRLHVTPTADFPVAADADSDAIPDLPMEDVYPARRAHRLARGVSARARPRPRRLLPVGHRSHVLGCPVRRSRPAAAKRRRVGAQRTAAGRGRPGPGCSTSRPGASADR